MGAKFWTHEEVKQLKKLAGKKTAKEIAEIIGRPRHGVLHKANSLGLNMRKRGEKSHFAKLSDLQAEAIGILADAGMKPADIQKVITTNTGISYFQIANIASCRSRIPEVL